MADLKEIVAKVAGNEELLNKVKTADAGEIKELLKKANIDIDDADIEKVKSALSDGKLDLQDVKDIAGGLFGKK